MNIIVDYGLGNLGSVSRGFARAGIDTKISRDLNEIKSADSLILPGVGAFRDAIKSLNDLELITPIKDFVKSGKYMIGICLGMQLLYEKSHEYGEYDGLGLIEGDVDFLDIDLKVPHMGWNDLKFERGDDPILKYIKENMNYVGNIRDLLIYYYGDKCWLFGEVSMNNPLTLQPRCTRTVVFVCPKTERKAS